ncbi:MAG: hemerythrin family protein [Alphaproteobacteria bacterium]|nr:hemerythrin family protein [Alphaproteobacteria bacterium]
MAIQWRDAMSVGSEAIDEDHKKLFMLVNLYEDAIAKHNLFELRMAFQGLVEYTAGHFEREEKLQEAIAFPLAQEHLQEHRELVRQLEAFNAGLSDPDKPRLSLEEAGRFLHDWIVSHVFREDMKMRPLLLGRPIAR